MVVALDPEQAKDAALSYFRVSHLPKGWDWVDALTPVHQRLFAVELADAIKDATIAGEARGIVELLDDWQATAELDASPDVLAEVHRPKQRRPLSDFLSA